MKAQKFRVTFRWLVAKEMSRVIEARNAEEAGELGAESLDDEGWDTSEHTLDDGDETSVVPAEITEQVELPFEAIKPPKPPSPR
jgi:hypothetical protein